MVFKLVEIGKNASTHFSARADIVKTPVRALGVKMYGIHFHEVVDNLNL